MVKRVHYVTAENTFAGNHVDMVKVREQKKYFPCFLFLSFIFKDIPGAENATGRKAWTGSLFF
jgi:hypothetical protein